MSHTINVVSYTLSCAAGVGLSALQSTLDAERSVLTHADYPQSDLQTWTGVVPELDVHSLPASMRIFDSRNNKLNDLALDQDQFSNSVNSAIAQLGASRVAVIVGSSTASMAESEAAWAALSASGHATLSEAARHKETQIHGPYAPARFVAERLGIQGPAVTVSTACSSSAKAFAMASRWLQAALVDAVIVGGTDSLSLITLYGFSSLGLLSKNPCRPFDVDRDGISVGEAAGFALLTRQSTHLLGHETNLMLKGYGESSDAHHMSHPHPQAKGAVAAMQQALLSSGSQSSDIGYLNLHGTATPTNDSIEGRAVASIFKQNLLASSTKGWTGHTLGAAGITGAVIALEALRLGRAPGTKNLSTADADCALPLRTSGAEFSSAKAMINTFGFGGSNCSLVFERTAL